MESFTTGLLNTFLLTLGTSAVFQVLKGSWGTWVVRILAATAGAGTGAGVGGSADAVLLGAVTMTAAYEWIWSGPLGKALNMNGLSRVSGFVAEALSKFASAIKTNGTPPTPPTPGTT